MDESSADRHTTYRGYAWAIGAGMLKERPSLFMGDGLHIVL